MYYSFWSWKRLWAFPNTLSISLLDATVITKIWHKSLSLSWFIQTEFKRQSWTRFARNGLSMKVMDLVGILSNGQDGQKQGDLCYWHSIILLGHTWCHLCSFQLQDRRTNIITDRCLNTYMVLHPRRRGEDSGAHITYGDWDHAFSITWCVNYC